MIEYIFFAFSVDYTLGFYLVGGLTHMRSMCVGVAETGVNTFLFLSFSFFVGQTKRTLTEKYLYVSSRANDVRPYHVNLK